MGEVVDFLFWWVVEPMDDWPHFRLILFGLFGLLLIWSTMLVVEDLKNPYAKYQKWLRPVRPGRVIAIYLAVGIALGAVAALVLPPLAALTLARGAGLLMTSLAVGVIASGIAHLRTPARSYSPRLVFWEYFALVAGLFATRLAI